MQPFRALMLFLPSQEVVKELQPCGQISYADVARAAERAGRRRLATMLLDLEPLASDQVTKEDSSLRRVFVFS